MESKHWAALLVLVLIGPVGVLAQTVVTTKPFSELAIYPEGSAPAETITLNDTLVAAQIGATVERIVADVGRVVARGDTLVQLECGDYERKAVSAEAQLAALRAQDGLAQYQLERARVLKRGNTVSEEVVKQREAEAGVLKAQIRGQEAAVRQARRDVERCGVVAPFAGVVVQRHIDAGEFAPPGRELLRLVDVQHVELAAQVPSAQITEVSVAQHLTFAAQGRAYPLRLRTVVPVTDPRSRSQELRLEFEGEAPAPGTSGRLVWRQPKAHLPADLIVRRDGGSGIFFVNDGHARFHRLPHAVEGRPAAVELSADTPIVVNGRFGLRDGDAVQLER